MASKNQYTQIVPGIQTTAHKTERLGDILRIIEKDSTISAWLRVKGNRNPELFIVLADKLSDSERNALAEVADVVVGAHDNLAKRIAELEQENRYLRSLSLTDGLTGLYNYRFFGKQLEVEMARVKRTGQPCSLMMIDLDDFKLLNDTLGHDEGNKFLVKVGKVLREKLRATDIMCRYGGDEFAVIMPATGLFDAMRLGQRLREALPKIPWKMDHPFSASIGLAEYDPGSGHDVGEFVKMADRALYRAKKRGKNSICFEGKPQEMLEVESVTREEKEALVKRVGEKVP